MLLISDGFKRDLRRIHLPDLPPAPLNCVRRAKYIFDIEYYSPTNLLCGEWKVDGQWSGGIANGKPWQYRNSPSVAGRKKQQ